MHNHVDNVCCLQVMGASITSQKEVIALYDVARRENMPSPVVLAGKPTFTSGNPPPLPPPMIRRDSEAPDLPPAYNPAVDNESAGVMSVESSISQGVENQSVDGKVDESWKKDLSISYVKDHRTEEAIGSTEAQGVYESVQGSEDGSSNSADYGEKKAMIAAQVRALYSTSKGAFSFYATVVL